MGQITLRFANVEPLAEQFELRMADGQATAFANVRIATERERQILFDRKNAPSERERYAAPSNDKFSLRSLCCTKLSFTLGGHHLVARYAFIANVKSLPKSETGEVWKACEWWLFDYVDASGVTRFTEPAPVKPTDQAAPPAQPGNP